MPVELLTNLGFQAFVIACLIVVGITAVWVAEALHPAPKCSCKRKDTPS